MDTKTLNPHVVEGRREPHGGDRGRIEGRENHQGVLVLEREEEP